MAIPYRNILLLIVKKAGNKNTRFIMSRKGDEVQPALEAAMKAKMTAELDELDDFWGPFYI